MSRYQNDTRVELRGDDTAVLPDPGGYPGPRSGDWHVERAAGGDGFVLHNVGGEQGYVTDEGDRYNRRPKVFGDRDAAIAYVIGNPQ
ncbi:MAG TPA: hypothetical protein VJT31_28060 [Rugosimonospora sp.]|nr:hypothetical protein [Rugosimonospora sp.]